MLIIESVTYNYAFFVRILHVQYKLMQSTTNLTSAFNYNNCNTKFESVHMHKVINVEIRTYNYTVKTMIE